MAKKSRLDSTGKVIKLRNGNDAIKSMAEGHKGTSVENALEIAEALLSEERSQVKSVDDAVIVSKRTAMIHEAIFCLNLIKTGDSRIVDVYAACIHVGMLLTYARFRIDIEQVADMGFNKIDVMNSNRSNIDSFEITESELVFKLQTMRTRFPNMAHKAICKKIGENVGRSQRTIEKLCSEFGITSKSY